MSFLQVLQFEDSTRMLNMTSIVSQGRLVSIDGNEEDLPASSSEPGTSTVIHDQAMDLVATRTAKRTLQNGEEHGSLKRTKVDHTTHELPVLYNRPDSYKEKYEEANSLFQKLFLHNDFGHVCDVCDRLWFQNDLTDATATHLSVHGGAINKVCRTCRNSLKKGNVPSLLDLCTQTIRPIYMLDSIVERIIAPRIPFMQIRRLRRDYGSYKIIGQVINVPVNVDETVQMLPRALDDDHAFNICTKKNLIHKSNYLSGYIKKRVIKQWLQYLIDTTLYRRYNITISDDFLSFPINETEEVEKEKLTMIQ